jgi:hypothetical protein
MTISLVVSKEEFFIAALTGLNKEVRAGDIRLLALLCSEADDSGIVEFTTELRIKAMSKLELRKQNISNIIGRLRDQGLLIGKRTVFSVNPQVLWKGNEDERLTFLNDRVITWKSR